MKKIKTIMAFLAAMTMTMGAMSVTAYADNGADSVVSNGTEEHLYTLKELIDMPDEEFLKLENTEKYYKYIKKRSQKDTVLYPIFSENVRNDSKYRSYYTEKLLSELISDDAELEVSSPSEPDSSDYYWWQFTVFVKNYELPVEEAKEEDYMFIAKIYYCLKQVSDLDYSAGKLLSANHTLYGDINDDNDINVRDAAQLANSIATKNMSKINSQNADFNNDMKVDVRDCSAISQFVVSKSLMANDKQLQEWLLKNK